MKSSEKAYLSDEMLAHLFVETQQNTYLAQLYQRYSEKVYRKCLSLVKDGDQARDYAHDIFLKLVVRIPSFRSNAKFSTWLYAITYNYCIDQIRLMSKNTFQRFDYHDASYQHWVEEEPATFETHQKIDRTVSTLSLEEQRILWMRYQDELSLNEIALHLGITLSATKMRVLRAKEKLRVLYLKQYIARR